VDVYLMIVDLVQGRAALVQGRAAGL